MPHDPRNNHLSLFLARHQNDVNTGAGSDVEWPVVRCHRCGQAIIMHTAKSDEYDSVSARYRCPSYGMKAERIANLPAKK